MSNTSKDLLHLELKNPSSSSSSSSLESTLRVCKNASLTQSNKKPLPEGKLVTAPVAASQVLGKVKGFLGVISEANKRLQLDAKEKSDKDFNIEVLSGDESKYIEMDLMLGVADLNTPEAVAAAESAIASSQPTIPLVGSSSSSSSEDEDDSSDDNINTHDDSGSEDIIHDASGDVVKIDHKTGGSSARVMERSSRRVRKQPRSKSRKIVEIVRDEKTTIMSRD